MMEAQPPVESGHRYRVELVKDVPTGLRRDAEIKKGTCPVWGVGVCVGELLFVVPGPA